MTALSLSNRPVHLGLGATAEVEPAFTGDLSWYEGYLKRHGGDGAEGRLVSMHTFTKSWGSWEMHPDGAELVLCTAGEMTLLLEMPDGSRGEVTLTAGEYAINAPGVWHTADVNDTATAVFVTAGQGTQHRPR